VGKTIDKT